VKSVKTNMRGPLYRYNSQTCRYERVPVSASKLSSFIMGIAICSAAMLAGLLLLHDFVIDTPAELAYRKENKALEKYRGILTEQLEEADQKLGALHDKDDKLHQKFFASMAVEVPVTESLHAKESILLADPQSFSDVLAELKETSSRLINASIETSQAFAQRDGLAFTNMESIPSLPLSQPVADLTPEKLLSGFGMRINPFHKGLYEHSGIDIAVPRGTEVLSTGKGKVITTKHSELQAGYGNYIEIDHGNGFITRYAHLEDIKVRNGQQVGIGFVIGTTGSSGGSVAPHLHYEIVREGQNEDPVSYMITGVSTDLHEKFLSVSNKQNQSLD
jgi:murein DD-endopeptidase MepM/ murein hydrolase activator NlpD